MIHNEDFPSRGHVQLFDRFGLGPFLDLVLFLLINSLI
jgi:hypothetical protein